MIEIKEHIGNKELLKFYKKAFLCSRRVSASAVLKCYDWAIEQREKGNCIISGFHSQIEKDVLHYLLKGKQPIIVVLARGLKEKLGPEFKQPIKEGRLLMITPFDKEIKRVTEQTASKRNKLMIDLADEVVVGFINKEGLLQKIIGESHKHIKYILE
ncbi:hypothetical protein BH10BAC2_BH10BAC2_14910 [soil metagenome]